MGKPGSRSPAPPRAMSELASESVLQRLREAPTERSEGERERVRDRPVGVSGQARLRGGPDEHARGRGGEQGRREQPVVAGSSEFLHTGTRWETVGARDR